MTAAASARPKASSMPGFVRGPGGLIMPRSMLDDQRGSGPGGRSRLVLEGASFEGAASSRWENDWLAPETNSIELIAAYQARMRDRCRALGRNAPWFVGLKWTMVDNIVGAANGWTLQARAYRDAAGEELDEALNRIFEREWKRWCRAGVDISRRESMEMFLRVAELEFAEVGEYFVLRRTLRDRPGRLERMPFALELIPAERLDPTYERDADPARGLNRITHGIEFDRDGRRVAYHFDRIDERGLPDVLGEKVAVPASMVCHRFLKLRAGQERGIPPLFAAILLMRDFDDAMDFEMEAWQAQSRFIGAIKRKGGAVIPADQPRDALDKRPVHYVNGAALLDLDVDEELEFQQPTRPTAKLEPFVAFACRTLGNTVGYSYEATTGDYSKVNFASGRLGQLKDRRTSRRNQTELNQLVLRPIYLDFVLHLVMRDRVPGVTVSDLLADPERYTEHQFVLPGWDHHDPLKEATAAGLRWLLGLSTLKEECGALGRDYEETLQQISRELKLMEELGIPRVSVGGASAATGAGNPGFSGGESASEETIRAQAHERVTTADRGFFREVLLSALAGEMQQEGGGDVRNN